VTAPLFQLLIDKQLGAVGMAVGKRHRAYRIGPHSAGDFPDGWTLVADEVPVHRNRVTSRDLETNLLSERTLWYELAGNMAPYLLGDVFMSREPTYQPGIGYGAGATSIAGTASIDGFALAWHALMSPPIGGRLDHRVGIYRPDLAPMVMKDGSHRWAVTHEADTPLILSNGVYSWGQPGQPASLVPCGFGSNDREYRQGAFPTDTIGIVPVSRFYAYLPILPGYDPAEGDAIVTTDDARFVVASPYTQQTGVSGHQMTIERFISAT
jgi:hypothetical protein